MSDTPARTWTVWAWGLLAPGLAHVRARRPHRALRVWLLFWALAVWLAGRGAETLHRPLLLTTLCLALPAVWLHGLVDAARLQRRAPRVLAPGHVCAGLLLAHWALFASVMLPPGVALIPAVPDLVEVHPTDQNAVSGAGGLTAGVSRSGVLTLLRWPGPAGRDHVDWRSVQGRAPGFGEHPAMGVFAGVQVGAEVRWFRDPAFTTEQRYASDTGDVIVTTHTSRELGLRAVETVFVHPERDLLVWRIDLEQLEGGPTTVRLLHYQNLAPCTFKVPYLATSDWALDHLNDFAAGFHGVDGVLVHARPLADAPTPDRPADPDAWIDGFDARYGPSVCFASSFASGEGRYEPMAQLGTRPDEPQDLAAAWNDDVRPFAAAPAAALLSRVVDLSSGSASETLLLAAGPTVDGPRGARRLLKAARAELRVDPDALRAEAEAESARWLARARLPATDDPHVLRLTRRSLLVIRNACDRPSGAVVASVAAQLPYALDWTRDGAFINLALDEAGYPELVTAHNDYYVRVQRQDGLLAGTWPMNTYEDGTPGGPIFLEIDNAALAIWTLADHARFLRGDEQVRYRQAVWPAIERGAEFFVRWRDPFSGLHLPAHEDDNPALTRGIQGVTTLILGLRAAEAAGRAQGAPAEQLERWARRREELQAALVERFWNEEQGRLTDGSHKELDASAWALWPCAVFPEDDPRAERQGEFLWSELQRALKGEKQRSGYDAKLFLALAWLWGEDHPRRPQLVEAYRRFAADLPTPDTGLLGEHCWIERAADGTVRFENINDMPHVWEHSLHYLTALRLFPPRR